MTTLDPSFHRRAEQRFIEHVERLLGDDRLKIDTIRGKRSVAPSSRKISASVQRTDRAVELKRLMIEMGKADRALQAQMPLGELIDVELKQRFLWVLRSSIGRLRVVSAPPTRQLLEGKSPSPLTRQEYLRQVPETARSGHGEPETLVIFSSSGFDADMRQ